MQISVVLAWLNLFHLHNNYHTEDAIEKNIFNIFFPSILAAHVLLRGGYWKCFTNSVLLEWLHLMWNFLTTLLRPLFLVLSWRYLKSWDISFEHVWRVVTGQYTFLSLFFMCSVETGHSLQFRFIGYRFTKLQVVSFRSIVERAIGQFWFCTVKFDF